ncbi:fumarate reductase cytochrome b subunit [Seongchinamella sediminis]|uniref:Fumarate reductase cytochrome b subunit n=1 Tax=Seongchinamella sediminis TaxID=2283635 RepID=A0A3L7DYR9_9GAMM|nr:fumarate reductase cytochrome b subunit [Seongchinamella sediminis]RLQ22404.1 fumarate reductase cytochrome b subunit [Seongchinamella sediminis]
MRETINRWPARLDAAQSLSGLLLVLFIWGHMFFESSILLGKDAMLWVTRMFEGAHVLGRPYPALVSVAAALVLALIALHALLALRKFPANYRQYQRLNRHVGAMRHLDTTAWYIQVITGFALFFLASAHLLVVMLQPDNIGPYASSDRVWSGRFWLLYAPLLLIVHLHAGIGIYRLCLKWGPFSPQRLGLWRGRLKLAACCIVAFYLCLGTASLLTYMRIGAQHAPYAGERYTQEAAE